jgi:hypothetical protein
MRKSILILLVAAFLLAPAFLFALPEDPTAKSPAKTITNLGEDFDNYLDPFGIRDVKSPLLFLQFDQPGSAANKAEFGFGDWFGGLYVGGYYGVSGNTVGNLASSNSGLTTQTDTPIVDVTNPLAPQILGKTSVTNKSVNYTTNLMNNPAFRVGYKLGDMLFSLGENFRLTNGARTASVSYNTSTGVFSNGTASSATKIMDTAGTVSYLNKDEYAVVTNPNGSGLYSYTDLGFVMPLGDALIRARAGLNLTTSDTSQTAAEEKLVTQKNAGYVAYTPTDALPGNSAVNTNDVQSWSILTANGGNATTTVMPYLEGRYLLPLSFFGTPATLEPGLSYALTLTSYSSKYFDDKGASQTLAGLGNSYYTNVYTVGTLNTTTNRFALTTVTTRDWTASTDSVMQNDVQPKVQFTVTPDSNFQFTVGLQPKLSFKSESRSTTGTTYTKTVNDPDGTGSTSTSYNVQEMTIVKPPYSETYATTMYAFGFYTGAEYFLIPGKFRINVGANINQTMYNDVTYTKTYSGFGSSTTKTTQNGIVTVSSVSIPGGVASVSHQNAINDTGAPFAGSYGLGFTCFFSPYMTLDAMMGSGATTGLGSGTNSGDIWNIGNYSFLMTIKFPPAAK